MSMLIILTTLLANIRDSGTGPCALSSWNGVIACWERLATIERKSWQDEILLQAADLIAYENYKGFERQHVGAGMRLTMKKILETQFRGRNARLTKESLQEWRDNADKAMLDAMFALARMKP